jgi:antitoxin HicB
MRCRLGTREKPMNADSLQIVIERLSEEDGGGYLATVPALPGCMADGETRAEALENAEDAISAWLITAESMGRAPVQQSREFA